MFNIAKSGEQMIELATELIGKWHTDRRPLWQRALEARARERIDKRTVARTRAKKRRWTRAEKRWAQQGWDGVADQERKVSPNVKREPVVHVKRVKHQEIVSWTIIGVAFYLKLTCGHIVRRTALPKGTTTYCRACDK